MYEYEILPTDPTELSAHYVVLSRTLDRQHDVTGDFSALNLSLYVLQLALNALPADADDASRAELTNKFYLSLHKHYKLTGDLEYLDGAIQYTKETVELTVDTPRQLTHLSNLSVFLSMKHQRTGDLEHLEEAIMYCEVAIATLPDTDSEGRASLYSKASVFLDRKFSQTQDIGDLNKAIHYSRDCIESSVNSDPALRTSRINNMGKYFYTRYKMISDIDDLRRAAGCIEDVMATMRQDQPDWIQLMNNAISFTRVVYIQTNSTSDFRKLISFCRRQVEAIPHGHPNRREALEGLSGLLIEDYEQTGSFEVLREAVAHAEQVVELTPPGHPGRANALSYLANYLTQEYDNTADLETLERAIVYNEEALALNDNSVDRAEHLSSMALSLGSRFERKGDLDDLRRSILYAKEGIAVANRWSHHKISIPLMHNIVKLQSMLLTRSPSLENLNELLAYADAALENTPADDQRRHIALSNMVGTLDMVYHYTKDETAIIRGIEIIEELLTIPNVGETSRSKYMTNLSAFIAKKNEASNTHDEAELLKALHYSEEALSVLPKDHSDRAGYLCNIGTIRDMLFGDSDSDALNETLRVFTEAWECQSSPPLSRISAARLAVECCLTKTERWEEARQMLEGSIAMLPQVSARSLEGPDKQQILSNITGLPTMAAYVALRAGKSAYHALGLLELSRGIIIGSTIDYRGDISDLKEKSPELSQKLDELRTKIDTPLPDKHDKPDAAGSPLFHAEDEYLQARSRAIRRREEALGEMEKVLGDIRKLPGCERFQLAPSEEDLKSWAKDGPVVTFTSSSYGSHAIILTSSSITGLPLPGLAYDDIRGRLSIIFEKPAKKSKKKKSPTTEIREYAERNQKMRDMLKWLWDVAVRPVLQHLEIIDEHGASKNSEPTHIWWIGTGRLNIAPFHAAGDHSRGSTQNALSHVISSYTPTIKALSYARGKKLNIFSQSDPRLLLVSMKNTPGGGALPEAVKEVEGIVDITKGFVSKHLEQPSANDVLNEFGSFEVMHFACHGVSNRFDPSESHLMLQKDSTKADSLTVAAISRKNAKTAQIAYLSACSTANNASTALADEIIHIASGFQLAGFNHVLATMWPAESAGCMEIAINFYRFLFDGKGNEEGHLKVSRAHHNAVLAARNMNPLLPRKWAPFIHLGA